MQHSFRFICTSTAAILDFRSSRVSEDTEHAIMYRFAKAAANLSGQAVRQVGQVRHGSSVRQDFHSKYGTGVLISGAVFCSVVWGYVCTQTGITWGLSPVKKLTPKPWREAEE